MFRHALHKTLLAAGILLGSHAAFAESRVALVIGQSAYRAVTALPNPANDAKAMAQLLGDAGFDVTSAADLSQNEMRQTVGEFAAKVAAKGPDTIALVFYAGHGLQIDGENFLVPVDVDPKREADIPLQAVRLNDVLNTLTSCRARCASCCSMPAATTRSQHQRDRRSGTGDRRRQDRRARHVHVVFDLARCGGRGRQTAPTAPIRRRCCRPPRSRPFDRGHFQACQGIP